jgi:hypothetical protein
MGNKFSAADQSLARPLLITIPDAAKLLGLSRLGAYRAAACGDLPVIHLGGRIYVVRARLRALLEAD